MKHKNILFEINQNRRLFTFKTPVFTTNLLNTKFLDVVDSFSFSTLGRPLSK